MCATNSKIKKQSKVLFRLILETNYSDYYSKVVFRLKIIKSEIDNLLSFCFCKLVY